MKISEIILERGAPPTYTDYTDPSVKGPNGEKLVVNKQGQVGYFKQQGRSTSFVAYDPKAQAAKPAAATSEPDPYAIDYSDAMTGMQGTSSSEPVSPEKAAAVQRLFLSFIPGIGTALDVKDAIEAASKGEYGEAAASSAFALLGLLPVVGAPTARAIAAAKNFARTNPKIIQAMQAKKAGGATSRVDPPLDPAPGSQAAIRAQVDKSYPAGQAGRADPPMGNTASTASTAGRADPPMNPAGTAADPGKRASAALGAGGVAAGVGMANTGGDAAQAAKASKAPTAPTTPPAAEPAQSSLSGGQKAALAGTAGAAVGAGIATAADKDKPQAQDQTQASKSVDKTEPKTAATTQYQIKPGDNLTKISRQFGTTINDIMKLNPQIKDPNLIYAGKTLNIPNTVKEHSSELARLLQISQRLKY